VLTGGVEALLTAVEPRRVRWNPPVLEFRMVSGYDGDLHLGGRGMLLVPSLFADGPAIDIDAEPQPVLRYPLSHSQASP
ncbi:ArsR family transcriptional regulator, partial [Streptomyces nanshensis]